MKGEEDLSILTPKLNPVSVGMNLILDVNGRGKVDPHRSPRVDLPIHTRKRGSKEKE